MMVGISLSFWVPAYLLTMEVEEASQYRQPKKQPMSLITWFENWSAAKSFFCGKMVTEGPIRVPVTQRIAGPDERIYTHNVTPQCQRARPTVPAKAERGEVDWPSVPHLLMRCCLRSSCSVWMGETVDRCTSRCCSGTSPLSQRGRGSLYGGHAMTKSCLASTGQQALSSWDHS